MNERSDHSATQCLWHQQYTKKEDGSQNAALKHAASDNRLGRHVIGEADSLRAIYDKRLNPVDDWSTNSERWL